MPARRILTVLVLALTTSGVLMSTPVIAASITASRCLVAAHRGDHLTATEDGMLAMRQAVRDGVEILEADVHATSDNRLVLMHDATLKRTTNGTGMVRSQTGAAVHALLLHDGSHVPYLYQLLDLARSSNRTVLLELKGMGGPLSYLRLRAGLLAAGSHVIIQSASPKILDRVPQISPGTQRAIISRTQVPVATVQKYGGIVIAQTALTDTYLNQLNGLPIYVYTVNDPAGWARFANRVTAVITNQPVGYIGYRGSVC
ncbi:MAG: hypothetical protein M3Y66_03145 [Actinomycetota bacterium]|nr:hypothetical protein [Actinomycetota bacterium]